MNGKTWSDVLGNNGTALNAYEQYLAERGAGETLGEWFERTSEALWGAQNEHDPDDDWDALADDLRKSAVEQAANEAEALPFTWCGPQELDRILYDAHGDGYTIGSNGDAQDFSYRQLAVQALAYQWELAESR